MALPSGRSDREYKKFVEDAAGGVAIRVVATDASGADMLKVEDTAHASGDTGIQMLAVRNDTLAALAGTDGDYAPIQVNASGALFVDSSSSDATHDSAVIATGPQVMAEAKTFDGSDLPNAVAEGDAVRNAGTLRGVQYTMPVNQTGSASPVVSHDTAIAGGKGNAIMMAGAEAKALDGSVLPNAVAEGDGVRIAASLQGVQFTTLVNDNGAASPIADHDEAIGSGNGTAVVIQGAEAKDFDGGALPNNVAQGDAIRLAASEYGVQYTMLTSELGDSSPIIPHDTAIGTGLGVSLMMAGGEAKDFDGSALPNAVAEGDAIRLASTLSGIQYNMLVNEDGSKELALAEDAAHTSGDLGIQSLAVRNDTLATLADTDGDYAPLQVDASGALYTLDSNSAAIKTAVEIMDDWDAVHDSAVGSDGPQIMAEAKDFDGSSLPNAVAEGDATRIASSLNGVQYVMLVNEDGARSPLSTDDSALIASPEMLNVGGEYRAADTTYADGDATILQSDKNGYLKTAGKAYDSVSDSDKTTRQNPEYGQHVEETLADVTNETSATNYYYLDMDGYRYFSIDIDTSGATPVDTLTMTIEAGNQDDGTAQASIFYTDVTNSWFNVASVVDADVRWEKDTPVIAKYVRIKTVTAGGNNDADYKIYAKRMA